MSAASIAAQIAEAWSAAFGRQVKINVENEGDPDVLFSVDGEGFSIGPDGKGGWVVFAEVTHYPASRWEPPESDLIEIGTEADLDRAVARLIETAREDAALDADPDVNLDFDINDLI